MVALIQAYERTEYSNTLKPLVDRLLLLLPQKPIVFSPDQSDYLITDIVRQIVVGNHQHGITSHFQEHMPSFES